MENVKAASPFNSIFILYLESIHQDQGLVKGKSKGHCLLELVSSNCLQALFEFILHLCPKKLKMNTVCNDSALRDRL